MNMQGSGSGAGGAGYTVQTMQEELEMLRCLKGHVIKTYKAGKFCDVTLKAKDGKEIKAHKLILYSQNSYFARKFEACPDMTEIDFAKFSGDVLQTVVDLMYFKPLNPTVLTKDNVQEYLKAGDTFFIDSIRDEASVFMAKNIDIKYALDMIQKPLFEGKMAEDAMNYVAENFQTFMSDEKLKKRMLTELKPVLLADVLAMRNLMLWDPKTGKYLTALEREKKLFFFILAYVAQEKERFEDLKMLLSSLKMSLLVSKKIINCHMIGAGLKKPAEDVSGQISDLIEPFDKLDEKTNLALFTIKDKKDKSKSEEDQKYLTDSCRLRYGSIPHSVHCSDVKLKLDPWSKMSLTRSQFCPGPFQQQTVECKKDMQSITVHVCRLADLTSKNKDSEKKDTSSDKETEEKSDDKKESSDKNTEECDKKEKDAEEKSEEENKKDEKEKVDSEDTNEKEKEDNSEKDDKEADSKEDEKDTIKDKASKDGEKDATEKATEDSKTDDDSGEWVLCGISLSDGTNEHTVGKTTGKGVKSKKHELEPKEFITEIYAHFHKDKISALDSRGRKKELVAQEMLSMTTVEDLSFRTNTDKMLTAVREGTKVGIIYKLPKQITRLEKDAPQNYWWLQGFGMETLGLTSDPPESRPTRFYPIWNMNTAHKYYPAKYEDLEFIAGVKKHNQFSVKGLEETCTLQSAQDLDYLERTPVHEVVDLGDSDEEDDQPGENGDHDDSDDDKNENESENRNNKPSSYRREAEEDSVMIVDSDSGDDTGVNTTNEDESNQQQSSDSKQGQEEYSQGMMNMMQHGIFGGIRDPAGAAVGPANPDSNDAIEPIEIPSSSDESDSEVSGKGKRKSKIQNGSAGKKTKS